jgi:hypothetical protein
MLSHHIKVLTRPFRRSYSRIARDGAFEEISAPLGNAQLPPAAGAPNLIPGALLPQGALLPPDSVGTQMPAEAGELAPQQRLLQPGEGIPPPSPYAAEASLAESQSSMATTGVGDSAAHVRRPVIHMGMPRPEPDQDLELAPPLGAAGAAAGGRMPPFLPPPVRNVRESRALLGPSADLQGAPDRHIVTT